MDFNLFPDLEPLEIIKGNHYRFAHMNGFTYAYWEVESGSEIPMHYHIHE